MTRSLILACFAGALCGCSVYTSDLLPGGSSNNGTGGTTGTGGTGGAPLDTEFVECGGDGVRATVPPPPTGPILNRERNLTCVSVQRRIDLGDRDPNPADPPTAYREIGFDLDNHCTTAADLSEGECRRPEWAIGSVDGPGGIDNSLGAITQGTRDVIQDFSSLNYSARLENGGISVLYEVSGYNGELNDDHVKVTTYVAAPFDSFEKGITPKWDGEDIWPVASSSLNDPFSDDPLSRPRFSDNNAYVSNGKVVAKLLESNLRLQVGLTSIAVVNLSLKLTGAVAVCDMVPVEVGCGFKATHCILSGRWNTNHLLHQLSQFPDPAPTNGRNVAEPLCTDAEAYQRFKTSMCRATDIFDGVATASSVCNSLSMGVVWETEPAILGDVFYMNPVVPRCPMVPDGDGGMKSIDPSTDCCERLPVELGGEGPDAVCPDIGDF